MNLLPCSINSVIWFIVVKDEINVPIALSAFRDKKTRSSNSNAAIKVRIIIDTDWIYLGRKADGGMLVLRYRLHY